MPQLRPGSPGAAAQARQLAQAAGAGRHQLSGYQRAVVEAIDFVEDNRRLTGGLGGRSRRWWVGAGATAWPGHLPPRAIRTAAPAAAGSLAILLHLDGLPGWRRYTSIHDLPGRSGARGWPGELPPLRAAAALPKVSPLPPPTPSPPLGTSEASAAGCPCCWAPLCATPHTCVLLLERSLLPAASAAAASSLRPWPCDGAVAAVGACGSTSPSALHPGNPPSRRIQHRSSQVPAAVQRPLPPGPQQAAPRCGCPPSLQMSPALPCPRRVPRGTQYSLPRRMPRQRRIHVRLPSGRWELLAT
jgi:hypothetical protein